MFKTKLIGLAGAAMMFSGMAFGQLCSSGGASSTPALSVAGTNNLRSEGLTELLPVITLTCPSTGNGTATLNVVVQIGTTPITSAVTNASTSKTEIALGGTINPTTLAPTTAYGTVSNNVVTFSGVTVPYTGGPVALTVSYIRVNASVLPSSGAFPTAVTAQAFISGITNTTSGISNSSTVAYAFSALAPVSKVYSQIIYPQAPAAQVYTLGASGVASVGATAAANPSYQVCTGQNSSSSNGTGNGGVAGSTTASFAVAVTENIAGAFKTAADEAGGSPITTTGTRIKLVFNNVPTGLNLYVPLTAFTINSTPLMAKLTTSETGVFTAPTAVTSPSPVSGLALLTVSGTSATAIYEITADNTNAIDTIAIPVTLGAAANAVTGFLTNPTLTVTTSLAPQTSTASQIPSFISTASDIVTVNTVKFAPCTTNLLFPFVTNANGFETGFAISNTTKDPFGTTAAQSGTCTLNYYASGVTGATNPTAVVAPNLAEGANQPFLAGETYAFTLTQSLGVNSANPATFQGYVIAQCSFVDAHGFAYILGGLQPGMFVNPNNTAMGYLALVLTGRGGGNSIDSVTF